jgi:hypothetical protein
LPQTLQRAQAESAVTLRAVVQLGSPRQVEAEAPRQAEPRPASAVAEEPRQVEPGAAADRLRTAEAEAHLTVVEAVAGPAEAEVAGPRQVAGPNVAALAEAEVAARRQVAAPEVAGLAEAVAAVAGPMARGRRVGAARGSARSAVPAGRDDAGAVASRDRVAGFPHRADLAARGVGAAAWSPARFCRISRLHRANASYLSLVATSATRRTFDA